MRRRWSIPIVGAVVAATVGTAVPASASWIPECELGPAPERTVIQNNGNGLEIHPLNAATDALAVGQWVAAYALCLEGGIVNRQIECLMNGLPSESFVEIQTDPPVIIIHYEELFATSPCE